MKSNNKKCIRCGKTDILKMPDYYRCNICGNKSLRRDKVLSDIFEQSAKGIFASLGIEMTEKDKQYSKNLAKRIANI